ncbi:MAG: hypothetical protein AAF804_05410 [Bacteroidota bacterium]
MFSGLLFAHWNFQACIIPSAMDLLTIAEIWLDVLAAILGVLSTIIGVVTAIRLLEWQDVPEVNSESIVLRNRYPKREALSGKLQFATNTPPISAYSNEPRFQLQELHPTLVSAADIPGLALKSIESPSLGRLRIALQNQGETIHFHSLETGPHNEAKVEYAPPVFRSKETYAKGTSLNVKISSPELNHKTFQFWVHFTDHSGKHYRQEIMGMGMDQVIVDPPQVY